MSDPAIRVRQARLHDALDLATIGTASFRAAYQSTADASDLLAHLGAYFGVAAVREQLSANGVAGVALGYQCL